MLILKNSKGSSLMGVFIFSMIGLAIVVAVARSIQHYSNTSQKVSNSEVINSIKLNAESLLRSSKAWSLATIERQSSCLPGKQGCPLTLWFNPTNPPKAGTGADGYNNNDARIWACPRGPGRAISFFDLNGSVVSLGANISEVCAVCKNSSNTDCYLNKKGLDPKKHVLVTVNKPEPTSTGPYVPSRSEVPPFPFSIEDRYLTRKKVSFDGKSSTRAFSPQTTSCEDKNLMSGYVGKNGTPECKTFLKEKECNRTGVTYIDKGTPECADKIGVTVRSNSIVNGGGKCQPGQIAVGIGPTGAPVCSIAVRVNVRCPRGLYLKGFDHKGNIVCSIQ